MSEDADRWERVARALLSEQLEHASIEVEDSFGKAVLRLQQDGELLEEHVTAMRHAVEDAEYYIQHAADVSPEDVPRPDIYEDILTGEEREEIGRRLAEEYDKREEK